MRVSLAPMCSYDRYLLLLRWGYDSFGNPFGIRGEPNISVAWV